MTNCIDRYVTAFSSVEHNNSLNGIGRGIEREALRITDDGLLAQTPHNKALGSALTHELITTDYAESLMEFITPVSFCADQSIEQLKDVQKFTLDNIDGELLWPMSIPCFVAKEDDIELAQYGQSNIGKMKTTYRQGLKNRYGSMMQIIAGIHFNFSFSQDFWRSMQSIDDNNQPTQDYISAKYFAIIRNYKRFAWLVPYLYGASPVLCPSFLQGETSNLPFEKLPTGAIYLPYATSLRMSDLGYTNSAQSELNICYNNIQDYIASVRYAINLPSEQFAKLGIKQGSSYQQLNANVLQIENELYAPIRPKQVAKSGEKPSEALESRGVQYIEVRALDVNPFSSTGIEQQQIYFLDVFLTFCAFASDEPLTPELQHVYEANVNKVIIEGRKPGLLLTDGDVEKTIPQWGEELFSQFDKIAKLLDKAYGNNNHQQAVAIEFEKIINANNTPSAKLIAILKENNQSVTSFALSQAKVFAKELSSHSYQSFDEEYFVDVAAESLQKQLAIEAADSINFDDFLTNYFKS